MVQKGRPVYFASRSLNNTEVEYAQIEKELLAITFSCKKFHNYIYGHNDITIHTDHMPLTSIINKSFDEIQNNRIKRLRLKLIIYNFKLKYIPGKKNVIGDFLSRCNIETKEEEDLTMRDVVHSVGVKSIKFSVEKLEQFQKETNEDKNLRLIKEYYYNGWPKRIEEIHNELKHLIKIKNDIEIEDELVYYNRRLIVPKKLRKNILRLLHETHLGFIKISKIAKELFYWPAITADMKSFISECKICNKYAKSQQRKTIINHQIPELPFNKVGIDIAEYEGKNYLILVDYFSKWLEVKTLKNKTATECIRKLKKIFSTHGIPEIVVSDNMPFGSHEYKQFAKEWNFTIQTTSPNYPKSNGQAEKAVGIVKNMFKKCKSDNIIDFELFKLNYNNSPVAGLEYSPAQILMSRGLRSKIPYKVENLKPKVIYKNAHNLLIHNKNKMSEHYNKASIKTNIQYKKNDKVWVQDIRNKLWSEGLIIKSLPLRSYLIRMNKNGRVIRRNDIFIKKYKSYQTLERDDEYMNEEEKKGEGIYVRRSERERKVPVRYGYT